MKGTAKTIKVRVEANQTRESTSCGKTPFWCLPYSTMRFSNHLTATGHERGGTADPTKKKRPQFAGEELLGAHKRWALMCAPKIDCWNWKHGLKRLALPAPSTLVADESWARPICLPNLLSFKKKGFEPAHPNFWEKDWNGSGSTWIWFWTTNFPFKFWEKNLGWHGLAFLLFSFPPFFSLLFKPAQTEFWKGKKKIEPALSEVVHKNDNNFFKNMTSCF